MLDVRCPKCGSTRIYETVQVWCPPGVKAYRCDNCYHTWWDKTVDVKLWIGEFKHVGDVCDVGENSC